MISTNKDGFSEVVVNLLNLTTNDEKLYPVPGGVDLYVRNSILGADPRMLTGSSDSLSKVAHYEIDGTKVSISVKSDLCKSVRVRELLGKINKELAKVK